jgi:hypothetical protein
MTRLQTSFPTNRAALVTFVTACYSDTASNLCERGDKDIFTVAEALGTSI